MLPDPASTMDTSTTVVSHAGIGPYNLPCKLGTALVTAINKQYTTYLLFLLIINQLYYKYVHTR
jgi:hypothetical protein